jgi:glycerol-3-phosphate cytidylyltransferase
MTKTYVPGTWDLFHYGHVALLKRAKNDASFLLVGINTDKAVRVNKGKAPIMSLQARMSVVRACRYVDGVVVNEMNIPLHVVKFFGIQRIVLGSDWKGKSLAGLEEAKKLGVKVVYYKYTNGVSSSAIKKIINEKGTI